MKKLIVLLFAASTLAGCTKNFETTKENAIQRKAPTDIQDSFAIVDGPSQASGNQVLPLKKTFASGNLLQIQKSALGKVFLLMASGKTGGATPQWLDLKPQVVSFAQDPAEKKLALLEENYNSVYTEIQTENLLQTFDIVAEDTQTITFDWGSGLHSFVMSNVFDTDFADPAEASDADSAQPVIPVLDSFVKSLQFDSNNLEINQISKIRTMKLKKGDSETSISEEPREETVAMNLQIRSYVGPSQDFKMKLADPTRRVGFFVNKLAKKGFSKDTQNFITKWDLAPEKGPVTFLLSEAFPDQYVQAATEGLLYWNKVFGREVVVVKTHVDAQANPQNRSVMVRWIPWLDAGAAYAQAQSDPLTGEILRGQIFMPSAFTRIGSLDQLALNGGNPVRSPTLNPTVACDLNQSLVQVAALSLEANDSQRLRLAQDSVRSTVAHEAGHALGLRHNFAGSFSAKVSADDIYKSTQTYLKDLNHPGLETTTSIMDYVAGYDDVLMAAYIKHDGLSYDKMAMKWAYAIDDKGILDEGISKYCTDEDVDVAAAKKVQIYGCERFDEGNNPVYRKYLDTKDEKETLAKVLFVSIMGRLYPVDKVDRADIDQVIADTNQWAPVKMAALKYVNNVLLSTTSGGKAAGRFVSFEVGKAGLGKDYAVKDEAFVKQIAQDLQAAGGYVGMLNGLLLDATGQIDAHWADRQVADLQKSAFLASGQTLGGRTYILSSDDQQKILAFYEMVAKVNAKSVLTGIAQILPGVDKTSGARSALLQGVIQESELPQLLKLVQDINSYSETTVSASIGQNQKVSLPVKFYSIEERAAFLGILSPSLLRVPSQVVNQALFISNSKAAINAVLLQADPSLQLDGRSSADYVQIIKNLQAQNRLDADAAQWIASELSVLDQI